MVLFFPLRVCNRILLTGYRKRDRYIYQLSHGGFEAARARTDIDLCSRIYPLLLLLAIAPPTVRASYLSPSGGFKIQPSPTFSMILYALFFFFFVLFPFFFLFSFPLPIHRSLSPDRIIFLPGKSVRF